MKNNYKIVVIYLLFLVIFVKAKRSAIKSDKAIETGIALLIDQESDVMIVK